MQPVIPLRSMKHKTKPGLPRLFDRPTYRQRNIIERMFSWLKESRRIGTRYDKLAVLPPWSRWLARCDAYDSTFRTEPSLADKRKYDVPNQLDGRSTASAYIPTS
jgi:transposase